MFQSITASAKRKPDEPCEGCGKRAPIRRLIGSGGAVIFKGNGFYETDYRSENYKKGAKADKDSQSGSTDKSGSSDKSTNADSSGKKKDSSTGKTDSSSGKSDSSSGKSDSSATKSTSSDKPANKTTDS
jgi:predicted nucleic acid-binding Zn ribbon protein